MTMEEAKGTSLERFGGFGQNAELGLMMWALAHIFNHASKGNLAAVQDHAALLAVMLEQASLDGGQWQVAWLLGLLEDPPQNLWLNRTQAGTGGDDPSEPCVLSQSWATIALAFKGDGDSLQQEVRGHRSKEPAQPRGESRRSTAEAKAKKAPRRRRRGPEQHTTAQPAGTRHTGVARGSSSQHVSYSKRGDNVPFLKSMQAKFKDLAPAPQKTSNIASFSFTFSAWCFSIIRWVLATRTDFGRYLASALCLRRDGPESSPTALFPLPLPSFHPAAPVDPKLSRRKRFEKMLDRPLLVVICALNYAYCARFTFPLELLRRQPNRLQQNAIDRLRLLIGASDPVPQLKSHPVEERIWS